MFVAHVWDIKQSYFRSCNIILDNGRYLFIPLMAAARFVGIVN